MNTEKYIRAWNKQPSLLYQSAETIGNNIFGLVNKFEKDGLTTKNYIKAALKQPALFCQSPETIENNIPKLSTKCLFVMARDIVEFLEGVEQSKIANEICR